MGFGGQALRWIIANDGYPLVVIGLFSGVAEAVIYFISLAKDRDQQAMLLGRAKLWR